MAIITRRAFGWCLVVVFGYLAFIDQVTREEAIAALACGVIIAAFMLRVEHVAGNVPLPPLRGFVNVVVRTPWALVQETWFLLGVVLWQTIVLRREPPGRWVSLRYEPETDRENDGRRALVILGSSISPNAIPLGVETSPSRLVMHQLHERREPGARDARYPF